MKNVKREAKTAMTFKIPFLLLHFNF